MSYVKTNWVNNTTPLNASNLNKIEDELEILDENITYSTTEQVVGATEDDKPIYRSRIVYSVNTGSTSHDVSSLNIKEIYFQNHQCKRYSTGGNTDFEGPYYSGANDYFRAFVRLNTGTIETRLQNAATTNTQISTMEYTKTTD